MATLQVSSSHDFRGETLTGIDRIEMAPNNTLVFQRASFSASQFGPGKIELDVALAATGFWIVEISLGIGATFSAAAFDVTGFPDIGRIEIDGTPGSENITGSAARDFIESSVGADTVDAGGGDDSLLLRIGSAAGSGDIYTGGDGLDTLDLRAAGDDFDFRSVTLSGFERVFFDGDASGMTALFTGTQLDALSTIAPETAAIAANLQAFGAAVSTAHLTFENWDANDTVTITGTSTLLNILEGSAQAETVVGNATGANLVSGGGGADTVTGGNAADRFVFAVGDVPAGESINGGGGQDELAAAGDVDFTGATIALVEGLRFASDAGAQTVHMDGSQLGTGKVFQINGSTSAGRRELQVHGATADLTGLFFANWTGDRSVHLLGTGAGDNLKGSPLADLFDGTAGLDTLQGGGGNDTFSYAGVDDTIAQAGELVSGGDGTDTLALSVANDLDFRGATISSIERYETNQSGADFDDEDFGVGAITAVVASGGLNALRVTGQTVDLSGVLFTGWGASDTVSIIGTDGADALIGSSQNDSIFGGADADAMIGGAGDDRYQDVGAGDAIAEAVDGGHDSVSTAESIVLADNVEDGTLITGFGRSLTGNASGNSLLGNNGNDTLTGLAGADSLRGGIGNDTLSGGSEADTLEGSIGNDTYIDPAGDVVIELANAGTDTVQSGASFTLGANVERLFLTGGLVINGTGNALGNQINGNTARNVLAGLQGDDTLVGGAGSDTLNGTSGADRLTGGTQRDKIIVGADSDADTVILTQINDSTGENRDVLTGMDFNGEDRIDLPVVPVAFAGSISTGALSIATFNADLAAAVNGATLAAGRAVLFRPSSGDLAQPGMVYLVVDANGVSGYQANQDWVFQLENHTGTLDPGDFV